MKNFFNKKSLLAVAIALTLGFSATAQTPFYTEEFNGSLNGWTNTVIAPGAATNVWAFTTTGAAGAFAIPAIISTTAANGWAIFDSDLFCSGNQDARLTSPTINCTGRPAVTLEFQQQYRRFFDQTFVEVSNDNGATWTQFEVNTALVNNDYCDGNPEIVTIDISSVAANQANVRIGFRFVSLGGGNYGCAYSWHIDDVRLLDGVIVAPASDTEIDPSDVGAANYFRVPASQIATQGTLWAGYVTNIGSQDQNNVTLNAEVEFSNDGLNTFTTVYTGSKNIGTLMVDSTELAIFDNIYTPNPDPGYYLVTYTLTQDMADADDTDNVALTAFEVTTATYGRTFVDPITNEPDITNYSTAASPGAWSWGTFYNVVNPGYSAVSFRIAAFTSAGEQVDVNLYECQDVAGDGCDIADFQLVGFANYTFGVADSDPVTIDILDLNFNPGVALNPTEYWVKIEYNGNDTFYIAQSDLIPYNTWEDVTGQLSQTIEVGGTLYSGFNQDISPLLEMNISPAFVGTQTANELAATLTVFPNPTSEMLTVTLNMEQESEKVMYQVVDAAGKMIFNTQRNNLTTDTFNFDVRQLPAGAYTLNVITSNGTKTERFVVAK